MMQRIGNINTIITNDARLLWHVDVGHKINLPTMIIKQMHEKRMGDKFIYGGLVCFVLEKKGFVFLDSIKVRMKKNGAIDAATLTSMGF